MVEITTGFNIWKIRRGFFQCLEISGKKKLNVSHWTFESVDRCAENVLRGNCERYYGIHDIEASQGTE